MAILWALLFNLALTLFVVNGVIWFRGKLRPKEPAEDRPMFGTVATSFGGGDFLGAALVVIVNTVAGQVSAALAGTGGLQELENPEVPSRVNWAVAWTIQALTVGVNWAIIAWRNARFLDWKWSGAAALLIPVVGLALILLFAILVTI